MKKNLQMKKWDKIYTIGRISNEHSLYNLAIFFTDDLRIGDELIWITDYKVTQIAFNQALVYKDPWEKIVISSQDFDDVISHFKINAEIFYKLCEAWLKIYPQYPDTLDLTQEGSKFTFEFDTKDGHQIVAVE